MAKLMTNCKLCDGTGQEFHLTLMTCRACNGACEVEFNPESEWKTIWSNYTKQEKRLMLAISQCVAVTTDLGEPTRCVLTQGHEGMHDDGAIRWEFDPEAVWNSLSEKEKLQMCQSAPWVKYIKNIIQKLHNLL